MSTEPRLISNQIALNKLNNMRAILQTHYQVRIEDPDLFAVERIQQLEEENAELKEELEEYIHLYHHEH
jgi:stress-induced morphogen